MSYAALFEYSITYPQQLLEALAHLAPDSSKTTLRSLIKQGRVTVNNQRQLRADRLLQPGQVVAISSSQRPLGKGIRLLYSDHAIAAIYKPAGLLSVATEAEREMTAHAVVKQHFFPKRTYVVHRLDQETSGVMLFALSVSARDELKNGFEKHDLRRCYTAIVVADVPEGSCGIWRSYLYEDARYVMHVVEPDQASTFGARLAITHWRVIAKNGPYARLELLLETGRKNQIRVHCLQAGWPIVGDKKYGYTGAPCARLALHAHTLELPHPITRKNMLFETACPLFFNKLVPIQKRKKVIGHGG